MYPKIINKALRLNYNTLANYQLEYFVNALLVVFNNINKIHSSWNIQSINRKACVIVLQEKNNNKNKFILFVSSFFKSRTFLRVHVNKLCKKFLCNMNDVIKLKIVYEITYVIKSDSFIDMSYFFNAICYSWQLSISYDYA